MAEWDRKSPQPQGSFQRPVPIPVSAPDVGPFLCPTVNSEWMAYVIGALKQLVIPSTWGDMRDPAVQAVQSAAQELIALFVEAAPCGGAEVPTSVRFTATCGLETSTDGGATWAAVPGWLTYAATCFAGFNGAGIPESIIDPCSPPNPTGATASQRACNIAEYLAHAVLQGALNEAQRQAGLTKTVLDFGVALLALIPGIDIAAIGLVEGANILYQLVDGGNLADYTAAAGDESLWAAVKCAIFAAIMADGEVTAGNFDAVVAAIGGVSYAHAEVPTSMALFFAGLGVQAVRQAQIAGALAVGDCSACLGWCREWNFTAGVAGWGVSPSDRQGFWQSGGWNSQQQGAYQVLDIYTSQFQTYGATTMEFIGFANGDSAFGSGYGLIVDTTANTSIDIPAIPAGAFDVTVALPVAFGPGIRLIFRWAASNDCPIYKVIIRGGGTAAAGNGLSVC